MPKGREITFYERGRIETYLRMRKKKTWIADKLNRDYSIIKRGIKRNSGEYLPCIAVEARYYADRRKRKTNKRKLDKWQNERLKEYVEKELQDGKSPQQISGRLISVPPEEIKLCRDKNISHESIYDWIYNGEGRYGRLYKNLRRKQKKRRRRFSRKHGKKVLIKKRVPINERPGIVEEKGRIGDWETDSVIFKGKSILSVQYERKSMLCRLHKCRDKTALTSEEALRD